MAGADRCNRWAAPVTLSSSSKASNAVRRFRSSCMKHNLSLRGMHLDASMLRSSVAFGSTAMVETKEKIA